MQLLPKQNILVIILALHVLVISEVGLAAEVSSEVKQVQTLLFMQGYSPGPADGLMGRKTSNAIKKYQSDSGLLQNGEISEDLIEKLTASEKIYNKNKKHIVISGFFIDHRDQSDPFTAYIQKIEEMSTPSEFYHGLRGSLGAKNLVSGVSKEKLDAIINKIPNKYIWVHMIIQQYDNDVLLTLQTPGTKTSWSGKEFHMSNHSRKDSINGLPKFKVNKILKNSVIDSKYRNHNMNELLGNLKLIFSDPL